MDLSLSTETNGLSVTVNANRIDAQAALKFGSTFSQYIFSKTLDSWSRLSISFTSPCTLC